MQMMLESFDLAVPSLILNQFFRNNTDNMVAMSYVNKMGGRVPYLSFVAEALWEYLLERGSQIMLLLRGSFS